jgi:hypothetical protein
MLAVEKTAAGGFKRNLLIEAVSCGIEECPIRTLRLGLVCESSCLANGSGGLATLDDGSTRLLRLMGLRAADYGVQSVRVNC